MSDQIFTRPSNAFMDRALNITVPVLDHGSIRVVDYMGNEDAIVQAARVSYGLGTDTPEKDRGLIRYLMRHRHSTPFEMAEIKLHVKLPVFVARQWIRHRTANVNEISGRYTVLPTEFYVPLKRDLQVQSKDNKQGRADALTEAQAEYVQALMRTVANQAFTAYHGFVEQVDLAKELARINLPLSTYTEWYWKIDVHNLLHFLSLRADPHAQMEIRVYADMICKIVQSWMPNVWEAFEDYVLHAHTFSRQEMALLRVLLKENTSLSLLKTTGMTPREVAAFSNAIYGPEHVA